MQTTLLGLAIAAIIALIGALAAPLYVDWTAHRALFEARLAAAFGAPVTIAGGIDAALLPTPRFVFRDIAIGVDGGRLAVAEAQGSLALGPLLRGDVHAETLVLVAPRVAIDLDAEGRLTPAGLSLPVSADEVAVRDGAVTVRDRRSGRTLTITGLDGTGALRGSAGPARLEGTAEIAGVRSAFRLSAAAAEADGLKLRLAIEPDGWPLVEIDGALSLDDRRPRFDGKATAGRIQAADGRLSRLRAAGTLAATPAAVRFDTLTLSFGPQDRALEMEGSARLGLGPRPRLDMVLGARRLDLDRAAGEVAGGPLKVLGNLLGGTGPAWDGGVPVRLGFAADAVMLGGEAVRDVRADLVGAGAAWTVEHAEARLPGRTSLRLAGEADGAAIFRGLVTLEAAEPVALMRWLDGGAAGRGEGGGPLKVQARVDFGPGRLALDDLKLDGAGASLAGRLAWSRAGGRDGAAGGLLTADLTGSALDLDALLALARTAGLAPAAVLDGEVRLNLGVAALRYAAVTSRRIDARLSYGAGTLTIERLSVEDFGGLSAAAQGRLTRRDGTVDGRLKLDLAADGPAGFEALAGAAALPRAFAQRLAEAMVPARVSVDVVSGKLLKEDDISAEDAARSVAVGLRGHTGLGTIDVRAGVPLDEPEASAVSVALAGGSGKAWMSLLGLGAPGGEGRLGLVWSGRGGGDGILEARFALPTFEAEARGRLAFRSGRLDPDFALTIAKGDLGELVPALGGRALPVSGSLWLVRTGETLRAEAIDARLAGTPVKGGLGISGDGPVWLTGALEAGRLDLPALVAALGGEMGTLPAVIDVKLTTPQLALVSTPSSAWTVSAAGLSLSHASPRSEIIVDAGKLAGGAARGRLALVKAEGGLAADLRLALTGASLAALLPEPQGGERPSGIVTIEVEAAGAGGSAADIPGALAGRGMLAVERLSWPALSPKAVVALAGLAGESAPVENAVRARASAALAEGSLDLPRVATTWTLAGGQVRASDVQAQTAEATLRGSAVLDMEARMLRVDLDIAPREATLPGMPGLGVRWSGPLPAPQRQIDVAAMVASLALAAAEREARAAEDRAILRAMPPPVEPAPLVIVPQDEKGPKAKPQARNPARVKNPMKRKSQARAKQPAPQPPTQRSPWPPWRQEAAQPARR